MDLLQSLSTQSLQTTYTYEPHRNLKTRVQNNVNSNTLSQYAYDLSGRRILVANTGAAFAQAAYLNYIYNDRCELIASDRYLGAEITDTTDPVPAEQRVIDVV